TNPVWLFGTDDYIQVPDNDNIDFALTDSFTLMAVNRQWSPFTGGGTVMAKTDGSSAGYMLQNGSGTPAQFSIKVLDGTNVSTSPVATKPSGTLNTFFGLRDVATDTVQQYQNGVAGSTATDTTTGTSANAGNLYIGRLQPANANYVDMEGIAFAIFRRTLTAAEITLITNYYTGRAV
ncbi:MAG: LamG-like jellyroll fold domain-containing protein, partial [Fluviibacter sp.]